MAKQLPPSFLTQSSLEDHPIFAWLEKNSRNILLTVIGIALLLGLVYRYASSKNTQAEQDYFQAANAVELLKDSGKAPGALTDLQSILARRPELNAKYDGIIAQNLLLANNVEFAKVYASKNFARIQEEVSPLFLAYAKNSLIIEENKPQEALTQALALKEEMNKLGHENSEPQFGPELYMFNLIRIAMLQHSLNKKQAESKSWEELLQISRLEHPLKFNSADVEKTISHFNDQGVSLVDFIQNNIVLPASSHNFNGNS